jgi:hypothetical protein
VYFDARIPGISAHAVLRGRADLTGVRADFETAEVSNARWTYTFEPALRIRFRVCDGSFGSVGSPPGD